MFSEMHVPEPALGATVLAAVSALVCGLSFRDSLLGEIWGKDLRDAQFSSDLGTRPFTVS